VSHPRPWWWIWMPLFLLDLVQLGILLGLLVWVLAQ
jgi:hypothetical protein